MARFDVFRVRDGTGYALDCQADVLWQLSTRFCVPLLPRAVAPRAGERLNPSFEVEGEPVIMVTQFAAALSVKELEGPIVNLADQHSAIMDAIDMLTTGY